MTEPTVCLFVNLQGMTSGNSLRLHALLIWTETS